MKELFLAATLLATSGCASYFSARDAHLAREYLTADIEDQIIFNLIRAENGLPFAPYDVSTVQSIVTDKIIPSAAAARNGVSSGFAPGGRYSVPRCTWLRARSARAWEPNATTR